MILVGAHIEVGEESKKSVFSDISKDAWYTPYIEKANSLQIVKGYGNTGTFMPDNQVTKAEFLKILFHAFEKDLSKHEGVSKSVSADTSVGQWYLPYLSYAKTMGIITPDFDNNLSPNKKLTRSECAEIIYKLLVIERGGEVQKLLKISESHLVTLLIDLSQNDIDAAIQNAEAAVQYSQKAIDASPNEGIVRAAHKIAKGFQQLCFGYKAGTEEKYDEVRSYVQSAKEFAGEAFNEHNGTQVLGKKIKEQGDILLQQIPVP